MNSHKCRVCSKKVVTDSSGLCLNCKILKNEYLKVAIDYVNKRSCTSADQIEHFTGINKEYINYFIEQGLIDMDTAIKKSYQNEDETVIIKMNNEQEKTANSEVFSVMNFIKQATG